MQQHAAFSVIFSPKCWTKLAHYPGTSMHNTFLIPSQRGQHVRKSGHTTLKCNVEHLRGKCTLLHFNPRASRLFSHGEAFTVPGRGYPLLRTRPVSSPPLPFSRRTDWTRTRVCASGTPNNRAIQLRRYPRRPSPGVSWPGPQEGDRHGDRHGDRQGLTSGSAFFSAQVQRSSDAVERSRAHTWLLSVVRK